MTSEAHKTARTAIYVVGGLTGLGILASIVGFAIVANKASNLANNSANANLKQAQINSQLTPG